MLTLPGAPALSDFRTHRLLAAIRSRVPAVESLATRYVHFAQARRELSQDEKRVLEALLTYGPRSAPPAAQRSSHRVIVIPRPGTISPWSSKATDIAHVCGLEAIERIERGIEYQVSASGCVDDDMLRRIAPALYDRMTETAIFSTEEAARLFAHDPPRPLRTVALRANGRAALVEANEL